jgi:hypothetical protein
MIAATATREQKQAWLMRPFNWASNVSWFSATFGAVYYLFGLVDVRIIAIGLVAALAANAALLLWGFSRMHRATR